MVEIQDFEVTHLEIDTPIAKPKCINDTMLKGYVVCTVMSSFKLPVLTKNVTPEF